MCIFSEIVAWQQNKDMKKHRYMDINRKRLKKN